MELAGWAYLKSKSDNESSSSLRLLAYRTRMSGVAVLELSRITLWKEKTGMCVSSATQDQKQCCLHRAISAMLQF